MPRALEHDVRAVCSELRARLRGGDDCRAETVFAQVPALADDVESALEVLYTEYATREELGLAPSADDLCARFPHWEARLRRLLDVHVRLGCADSAGPHDDTPVVSRTAEPILGGSPPAAVGAYELLEPLGRGGMGAVYKARHRTLKRLVALKQLLIGAWASAEEAGRFRTEAEAIAQLDHANIVKLYEIGESDGQPYLVLELVQGGSLADLLTAGPLPAAVACQMVEALARGLAHAHARGILHRDLKPANVLLVKDEPNQADQPSSFTPKIADFGLAKRLDATHGHSTTGRLVGTPAYLAPERIDGQTADPASDIYALGVILYECLTGRPPFLGDSPLATLAQARDHEPVPPTELRPDCPRDLATICLKCLDKEPHRRYASAAALADELQRFRQGEPIQARPTGAMERMLKWARRRPAVAGVLALVLFLVVGGGAVVTFLWLTTAGALADKEQAHQATAKALVQTQEERAKTAAALAEVEKQRRALEAALAAKLLALAHRDFTDNRFDTARAGLQEIPERYRDADWRRLHRQLSGPSTTFNAVWRIHSLGFDPKGGFVGIHTVANQENFQIWDRATGQAIAKVTQHAAFGFFMGSGQAPLRIVTRQTLQDGGSTITVKPFELDGTPADGKLIPLKPGFAPILLPDARMAVGSAATGSSTTVAFWNLDTGQEQIHVVSPGVGDVRVAPAGDQFGIYFHDDVKLKGWKFAVHDLPSGKLSREFHNPSVRAIDFSPDFRSYLALVAGAGKEPAALVMFDALTHQVRWTRGSATPLRPLTVFSADAALLAVTGDNEVVFLLDAKTGAQLLVLRGHGRAVRHLRFSPDNHWLATVDDSSIVRVWDIADPPK